jgi:hypothetical protein
MEWSNDEVLEFLELYESEINFILIIKIQM